MKNGLFKYLTVLILSLAGSSIYTVPYIKYVFYDIQLEVMNINHMQSGFLLTIYALGCICTYIPGGIITDRVSPRKALCISLWCTALLSTLYAYTLSYHTAIVIWFLFAISTAFVFWTSLLKAISMAGNRDEQARLFGVYYAGSGLAGALINTIALKTSALTTDPKQGFVYAIMVMAFFSFICGFLVFLVVKEIQTTNTHQDEKFHISHLRLLLKTPILWCFSFIVFTGYAVSSSTTYFTPYLTNVIGISVEESGFFSIIRSHLFYLIAPLGGYLADKVFRSTAKLFIVLFGLLAMTFIGMLLIESNISPTLISIYTLLPGALGLMLYGLVFSIMRETNIPLKFSGTAIGIASIIGYAPDLFMSTMFGYWLDNYGNDGYTLIFTFLFSASCVGMILSAIILKQKDRSTLSLHQGGLYT
ncbi:MFS transporter [Vibrio sagamiensis]|uniref:MFS transporter n=1 Tax=Vibrio sagamiensis NBRC 104589 TaxID=1219064 RepID=A0A511QEM0_9VIBR|nr:MFS transporter [Vibrio sagamiensis]PNQ54106.1 MFS transporter [Vibrio agarivorans]GEM75751.1 MFS transporter [Vibrio sagamiensis NBRC 104589]